VRQGRSDLGANLAVSKSCAPTSEVSATSALGAGQYLRRRRPGDRQEAQQGLCGREGYARSHQLRSWRDGADGALRDALVNLESLPAPPSNGFVLGSAWPCVTVCRAVRLASNSIQPQSSTSPSQADGQAGRVQVRHRVDLRLRFSSRRGFQLSIVLRGHADQPANPC